MPEKIKKHWKVFVALILLVIIGLVVYAQVLAKPNAKVTTATVSRQDLKEILSLSGKVAANEDVNLSFQTSGYLNWVGVKVGDHVKKFQVIASLDQRSVKKTLEKYLNSYKKDRNAFDDTSDTYENQIITDSIKRTLEDSQADLTSSVLDVELQNLALQFSNLWTPIDGIVVSADSPNAGVNITPTQANFRVINPNTLYFLATVDQADVILLSASQSAEIVLDSFSEEPIKSSISNIAFIPKTGETGTVYEVKMTLPMENSNFRVGMTGDANFVTKVTPNALVIPTKYIKSDSKGKHVWVKTNMGKARQDITVGESVDNLTEIKSGVTEGTVVYES